MEGVKLNEVVRLDGGRGYDLPYGEYRVIALFAGAEALPTTFDKDAWEGENENDLWVTVKPLDEEIYNDYGLVTVPVNVLGYLARK